MKNAKSLSALANLSRSCAHTHYVIWRHANAVRRRIVWVNVDADLRRTRLAASGVSQEAPQPDDDVFEMRQLVEAQGCGDEEEDVAGFGAELDWQCCWVLAAM